MYNVDVYAFLASKYFNEDIEDCMEYKNGQPNILGKSRRFNIKSVFVSLLNNQPLTDKQKEIWNYLTSEYPRFNEIIDVDVQNKDFYLPNWLKERITI